MVTIPCPWCDEDELLAAAEAVEPALSFTCDDCGTSISFADEPPVALELAA